MEIRVFFYKQREIGKQTEKNRIQAHIMLALCLFIKYFAGCILTKRESKYGWLFVSKIKI